MLKVNSHIAALLIIATIAFAPAVGTADMTTNGDFELGDTSGWASFPSGNSSFDVISGMDVFGGAFSGKLENLASGSAAIVKQANLGVGIVQPGEDIIISFWAKGSAANGGVQFAEFFSEIAGGGVSSSVILGGGPLFLTNTYEFYEFTTQTGGDVSGGVTLQLGAITGATTGSTSTMFVDDVVVRRAASVPEPATTILYGIGGLGLLFRRRRS